MTVDLGEQEWQQVLNILATAPWNVANPLLMRIGQQLQSQRDAPPPAPPADVQRSASGNGKEARHE